MTIVTVVVAALWSGWWFIGSRAAQQGAIAGIDAARAQGWTIAYDDLSVAGFPNRFDTTVSEPRVTTPDGTVEWSAPFVQVFSLAYRLNHVIAVAPPRMSFEVPGEAIDVTNADLRASVVLSASAQPVLDRSTVTMEALRVALADLWVEVATGRFATRQAGGETAHDVALSLSRLTLSPSVRAALDPAERLPELIDGVEIEVEVGLTDAVGPGRTPQVQSVLIRRAEVTWGETRANLAGEVSVGSDGFPAGALMLGLRNWEPLILNAVAQGLLTPGEAAVLNGGIGGLARSDGEAQVPVTLADGQLSVLGLPIAVLPRL